MKSIKYIFLLLSMGILLIQPQDATAQRYRGYLALLQQNNRQSQFYDFMVLPGKTDSTVNLVSTFSISYKSLEFKKMNEYTGQKNAPSFYSPAKLSLELFYSNKSGLPGEGDHHGLHSKYLRAQKNISVDGLKPAGRTFWADTARASNYQQTKSNNTFLTGRLELSLKPGMYKYVLQRTKDGTNFSKTGLLHLNSFSKMKSGNIILGDDVTKEDGSSNLHLIGMGNQVRYGKDFYALAFLPGYQPGSNYTVTVNKVDLANHDTTAKKQVFLSNLSSSDIYSNVSPQLASEKSTGLNLSLAPSQNGYTYALLKIPNHTFENASYMLKIQKDGDSHPAAQKVFRSIWIGMPRSLLNLDVSIDMLRFIANDKTVDRIDSGSREEKEQKFRKFWHDRDPTPNTEYNELMAEYYKRIDYAFEHFSTEDEPGYKSDQGKIYVKFGAPKSKERKFPDDGRTVEIWTYPNHRFVFKATSGFGDFKLVSGN